MGETLRNTIKKITLDHLNLGNSLFSQCISAVGFIGGTVPENAPNLVELSMADVMAGGIVVGSALAGKRPIYIVRYQGFQWFNSPIIANYAGKSKDMWQVPCPIFIRSIAMEGAIGPVAGSSHHGIYYRMPGIKIASPMTPNEYTIVYSEFMSGDDTVYVSEHRKSYDISEDLINIEYEDPDIVLFPFSITRLAAIEASKKMFDKYNLKVNVYHQLWINPLRITDYQIKQLTKSKYGGIVLDDDYPNGIAKQIAYELMIKSNKRVYALGIKEKTAGFQQINDNLPPGEIEIEETINKLTDR